jgi:hypothetical protein
MKVSHIVACFVLQVSLHDGLPQQICYECLSRIELFHSYKQSCLESQHTLKHWNLFCDGGELKVQCTQNEIVSVHLSVYFITKITQQIWYWSVHIEVASELNLDLYQLV